MNTTKIVFIGAGSMSFGKHTFRDLFLSPELKGSTLALVDIDAENLDRMQRLAEKMNEATGAGFKIASTANRREVLAGAEFVLCSIALERCALWKMDFEIPKKYGIRQTLGENGGPGGLFFTLRTLPVIMDILRDMEDLCPNAFFLNFSNPENRIILAAGNHSSIRCVGLCHGLTGFVWRIAKIMGIPGSNIDVWAAGLNHFQWLIKIRDKQTGADLYPLLRERSRTYDPAYLAVSRKLMDVFGLFPSPSDDHIGEYLPYGWEGGEEGYDFAEDAQYRIRIKTEIEDINSGRVPVAGEWLTRSSEKAADVIVSILNNRKCLLDSAIVINQGAIANLPDDAAVEVPVMLDYAGIHPVTVGALPLGIENLIRTQIGVQKLAVQAALTGSRELALQALLTDPVVHSITAAEGILNELWEINRPYIRSCGI
ncbi:MAG TPA: alpha-glucosidase/alpha-galactosidase [Clostridiales bacterium]|nr:alpha-glucosidase/alpha-galactosidase [Clostridiales bacterium]